MRNKIKHTVNTLFVLMLFAIVFTSCNEDYQPKPRAYFRIQLPEKQYEAFQAKAYPYSFNVPSYAQIRPAKTKGEKYWINIYYPYFNAQLYISYKPINNNLDTLLNDMHNMMNKHIPKANAINEQMFLNEDIRVFGMAYEIKGTEAATPYQFYLTDSINHFIRGALYFNFSPNNDSLKPVIDYLQNDARELIDSFRWQGQ